MANDQNIIGAFSYLQTMLPQNILRAFDTNHDGTIRHEEFSTMLDNSRDSQSGVMRSIMEVFFTLLAGSDQAVDVERDASRVAPTFREATRQVTGRDLGSPA